MQNIIGIDIGGTFTDFVSYDPKTGEIHNWKNLTTPAEPIDGVLEGRLVGLRWLGGAGDLAHVLQGSGVHLVRGGGRLEVVEGVNVAAHAPTIRGPAPRLKTLVRPGSPPAGRNQRDGRGRTPLVPLLSTGAGA